MLDVLLQPLRRLARLMGESGGFLLMIFAMAGSNTMLDVSGPRLRNILCLAVMFTTLACIYARAMDGRGHRAANKIRKKAKKAQGDTSDHDRLAAWLGVSPRASSDEIKTAARRKMMEGHSDTGTGGVDMDDIKKVRDWLIANPVTGAKPEVLLAAWRKAAGRSGQFWGALLPSDLLLELQAATGESLWPRWNQGIARNTLMGEA